MSPVPGNPALLLTDFRAWSGSTDAVRQSGGAAVGARSGGGRPLTLGI